MHGLDTSNVSSRVESSQVEFELKQTPTLQLHTHDDMFHLEMRKKIREFKKTYFMKYFRQKNQFMKFCRITQGVRERHGKNSAY